MSALARHFASQRSLSHLSSTSTVRFASSFACTSVLTRAAVRPLLSLRRTFSYRASHPAHAADHARSQAERSDGTPNVSQQDIAAALKEMSESGVYDDSEPIVLDKILLKNLQFYAYHGVYTQENTAGQPFEVDLELEVDLSQPAETDDIADTVDYGQVYGVVKSVMEGPNRKLLEYLSLDIIGNVLESFPAIYSVKVQLRKPKVDIGGYIDYAAVEMTRSRQADQLDGEATEEAHNEDELDGAVPAGPSVRSSPSEPVPPPKSTSSPRVPFSGSKQVLSSAELAQLSKTMSAAEIRKLITPDMPTPNMGRKAGRPQRPQ